MKVSKLQEPVGLAATEQVGAMPQSHHARYQTQRLRR
jgi:hypothetical protein